MFLRVANVKSGKRTYRYVQLVESYRRPSDKRPTHRVRANLGDLPELQTYNLQLALKASREGKRLRLDDEPQSQSPPALEIEANLRYLDVAAALRLWYESGLAALLEELLPAGSAEVSAANVLAALVIQRCVAPGSKLAATEWFPRTALPELLGIAPQSFTNSRLHRQMKRLEAIDELLQLALTLQHKAASGGFYALLLDGTDTWFEGRGPELAEYNWTKQGQWKRKIGILLLCDQDGFPLRWKVFPGRCAESRMQQQMLQELAGQSWVGQSVVVCDRLMGQKSSLRWLLQSGLRFLTAVPAPQIESYTRLPSERFESLSPPAAGSEEARQQALEQAARQRIEQAGFAKLNQRLYLLDLGKVAFEPGQQAPASQADAESASLQRSEEGTLCSMMALALEMEKKLRSGRVRSQSELAQLYGRSQPVVSRLLRLVKLAPEVRSALLEGRAEGLTQKQLLQLSRLAPEKQLQAFEEALAQRRRRRTRPWGQSSLPSGRQAGRCQPPAGQLRLVLGFNPQRFAAERLKAHNHLDSLQKLVEQLNEQLAQPASRLKPSSALRRVQRKLEQLKLLDCFELQLQEQGPESEPARLRLELRAQAWARRRRTDGFWLLVAHPLLEQSAAELARLYFRAKDNVEKDFQTLKSTLRLRPVYHRTSPKVRAHVTLCILALYLERLFEQRLRLSPEPAQSQPPPQQPPSAPPQQPPSQQPSSAPPPRAAVQSARAGFELLSSCHLNRCRVGQSQRAIYSLTQPDPQQWALLRALGFEELADSGQIATVIVPRGDP